MVSHQSKYPNFTVTSVIKYFLHILRTELFCLAFWKAQQTLLSLRILLNSSSSIVGNTQRENPFLWWTTLPSITLSGYSIYALRKGSSWCIYHRIQQTWIQLKNSLLSWKPLSSEIGRSMRKTPVKALIVSRMVRGRCRGSREKRQRSIRACRRDNWWDLIDIIYPPPIFYSMYRSSQNWFHPKQFTNFFQPLI